MTSSLMTMLLIYVDDIIVIGDSTIMIQGCMFILNDQFALKDTEELHFFPYH